MTYLCIHPVCGAACSDCNMAISQQQVRDYATRYAWLREQDWFEGPLCVLRDPKRVLTKGVGLGADCPSRDRLDTAIDAEVALAAASIGAKMGEE
jgi:hypothetical protein